MIRFDETTRDVLTDAARIGLQLTGSHDGAREVVAGVLRRFDRPAGAGETALHRTIVQESRAFRESAEPDAELSKVSPRVEQLWYTLRGLTGQQREAWMMLVINQMSDVDAARAMDCSRTALRQVHMSSAESALKPLLGEHYDSTVVELRSALSEADVSQDIDLAATEVRRVLVRRRVLHALGLLGFFACCLLLWWVMSDLHHANEREVQQRKLREQLEDQFSNPKRDDEQSSDQAPSVAPNAPQPGSAP